MSDDDHLYTLFYTLSTQQLVPMLLTSAGSSGFIQLQIPVCQTVGPNQNAEVETQTSKLTH